MSQSEAQIFYENFTAHQRKQHEMQPEFPAPTPWEGLTSQKRDEWAAGCAATARSRRAQGLDQKRVDREEDERRQLAQAKANADAQRTRADGLASDLMISKQRAAEVGRQQAIQQKKLDADVEQTERRRKRIQEMEKHGRGRPDKPKK